MVKIFPSITLPSLTVVPLTPDPTDPHLSLYDVDDASTVITLADWYHNVRFFHLEIAVTYWLWQFAPGMEAIFLEGNDEPVSGLSDKIAASLTKTLQDTRHRLDKRCR